MDQPQTKYAQSGDLSIAYQVVGDGPIDVVFVSGWVSSLTDTWENPAQAKFMQRIASYSRLILFDKRGTGMSDPVTRPPTLEERIDDMRAVMDAVDSERAAVFGISEGGPMSILYAATYPERVTHLVLSGSGPRAVSGPDYPFGQDEQYVSYMRQVIDRWGEGNTIDFFIPDLADDTAARAAMARFETRGASPSMARHLLEAVLDIDVRDALPVIQSPTLIHHREGDRLFSIEGARYMAERIGGAELMIQPGTSHIPWFGGGRELADRVEAFITGRRPQVEIDRVLATVLFTDIVDSTVKASELADRAWRDLLDQHDSVVDRNITTHRGRLVKMTGDGVFATFDRPAAAVRCAMAIRDEAPSIGIDVRAGLHTGEVELRGEDLGGIGVHIGARIAGLAERRQVLVSRTVRDLVTGSGLQFTDRGMHELKGVPQRWQIYEVTG